MAEPERGPFGLPMVVNPELDGPDASELVLRPWSHVCRQCGRLYEQRACGPSHACIQAELEAQEEGELSEDTFQAAEKLSRRLKELTKALGATLRIIELRWGRSTMSENQRELLEECKQILAEHGYGAR